MGRLTEFVHYLNNGGGTSSFDYLSVGTVEARLKKEYNKITKVKKMKHRSNKFRSFETSRSKQKKDDSFNNQFRTLETSRSKRKKL